MWLLAGRRVSGPSAAAAVTEAYGRARSCARGGFRRRRRRSSTTLPARPCGLLSPSPAATTAAPPSGWPWTGQRWAQVFFLVHVTWSGYFLNCCFFFSSKHYSKSTLKFQPSSSHMKSRFVFLVKQRNLDICTESVGSVQSVKCATEAWRRQMAVNMLLHTRLHIVTPAVHYSKPPPPLYLMHHPSES